MFQRFHEMREKREAGFTLIELLVVILIIAILAAIAIPVFLAQRRKGWVSQAESALKNAATAMESYATGNNGDYPTAPANATVLATEGYRATSDVTVMIAVATTAGGFCLTADHANLGAAGSVDYIFDTRAGGAGAPVAGTGCS